MIEDDETQAHRVQALSAMIECPGWDAYFAPVVKEKLDQLLYRALAGRASMSEGALKAALGEASVLQWVLSWPQDQIREFNLAVEEEIVKVREEAEALESQESVLAVGRHGPFSLESPEG